MITADLHIHGKYSQATSKDLTIPNLEKWAKVKGINLLGTGDFTHPKWIEHIKEELTEDDSGILRTNSGFPFLLQTEISLIYSQNGKGRRIHNVVLAPNLDVVKQITDYLLTKGRIDYDGRPIFGIPCPEFVENLKSISNDIEIIPAHIWTPWFSLFGSKSGFDRIEDCFKDMTKHIHALETGLSSDPAMNWRLSALDKYSLVSFSDLHSFWPWRIGREATVFDLKELTYQNLIKALRTKQGLVETIEVDPNYGKYHVDGHRKCNVRLEPEQTKKLGGICPVCKRPLTIGVLYRVEELADREPGFKPADSRPFKSLIPLSEVLSKILGKAIATKTVWQEYNKLLAEFNNEMNILLNVSKEDLLKVTNEKIADIILKNRLGDIEIQPGFDGEYGIPVFNQSDKQDFSEIILEENKNLNPQKSLGDF
ncbi:endonuclease Q family protein [Candidatus Woesearchaeota archaeon]|nr:endonuclease Q family protein [Candidatus Woesearchaeota archaeon]